MMHLRISDIAAVVALALVLIVGGRTTTVPPSQPVRPECASIVAVLRGHADEAQQLAAFYAAAADMIDRDASGARILATKHQLRTALERAAVLRFQGAFAKVAGLSDAIHGPDGALAKLLGLEAGPLDHRVAADAMRAVAAACREAAR